MFLPRFHTALAAALMLVIPAVHAVDAASQAVPSTPSASTAPAGPAAVDSLSVADRIEYGRHLVRDALGCADCHTPRGRDGAPLPGQDLHGSKLAFAPLVPIPWADHAPWIAALPQFSDAAAVRFLMTGGPARPPMPAFRLSRAEAEAVVAYLRTLR